MERRALLAAVGPDDFGYVADPQPLQSFQLNGDDPAVFTVIDSDGNLTAAVDLGANTFDFYGQSYSGAGQLFVESTGAITFAVSDTDIDASLTGEQGERIIAPLFSDGGDLASRQVVGKFQSTSGDATPELLILQWTGDLTGGEPSPIEFQAVLQLNTGTAPGDITFNYPDLDTGDANANGASAIVAIRNLGVSGEDPLLISSPQSHSALVGTGKSIRIHVTSNDHPQADPGGPYMQDGILDVALNASRSSDPHDDAGSLTYQWDFDGDGTFGEFGDANLGGFGDGAGFGDEVGIEPTFDAGETGVTYTVFLRVTNSQGLHTFASTTLLVTNNPPTASIAGPATAIVGLPYSFTFTADDPGDVANSFGFQIDWGDGSNDGLGGAPTRQLTHNFTQTGEHAVSFVATDDLGAASDPATLRVNVIPRPDLQLTDDGILVITTGSGDDTILLSTTADSDSDNAQDPQQPHTVTVTRNGVVSTFATVAGKHVRSIDIDSGAGDDRVDCTGVFLPLTIAAGDGNDTITGGIVDESINAGDGNDTIVTGDGNNMVDAGGGDDTVRTGIGNDFIDGGDGDDSIDSGDGIDHVITGGGRNRVHLGEAGEVHGGSGNDTISGGEDALTGGGGGMTVFCGGGADSVTTGPGDDVVTSAGGAATISTGDGNDLVSAGDLRGGRVDTGNGDDLVSLDDSDAIDLGDGNDFLTVHTIAASPIHAGAGDDTVRCNSNPEHPAIVFGEDGNDYIFTGAGRDSIYGGAGRDTVHGGAGGDLISGGGGNDVLFGQGGKDRLYGGNGNDRLEGQSGDDRLVGGAGADVIRGGEGTNAATHDDPLDELTDIQSAI